jgi:hypothetical protein
MAFETYEEAEAYYAQLQAEYEELLRSLKGDEQHDDNLVSGVYKHRNSQCDQ